MCKALDTLRVAKAIPHFGEEPPITGSRGSGTIFFAHCNLKCCFCQNYQISHEALGNDVSVKELSTMMLNLQERGCHNINLVSASHYLPFIGKALYYAAKKGLSIPLVYNTNGYEDINVLRLLDGMIDIYLPDVKYADDINARKYSFARNYNQINLISIKEMFRQVGFVYTDNSGIALKGLIVRHLVLPGGISGTNQILKDLKKHFGPFLSISLMSQYIPFYYARKYKELSIRTPKEEYLQAIETLESLGFEQGWVQDWEGIDTSFSPDLKKSDTWN